MKNKAVVKADKEFTVISLDGGEIKVDYVFASEGIKAFAKVVSLAGVEREFVAAILGHHKVDQEDGSGITLPGESVVDGQTIEDQPEVFGEVEQED